MLGLILALSLADAPRDVRVFIERREGCEHFAGETGHDEARRREIGQKMRELRCDRIEIDEQRMLGRYAERRDVLALIKRSPF